MFCGKCGHKLQEGERFCSVCGNPIEKIDSPEQEPDIMAGMGYGYKPEHLDEQPEQRWNPDQRQVQEPEEEYESRYERRPKRKKREDDFDDEWEREERKEMITFVVLGVIIVALVIAIVIGVIKLVKSNDATENKRVPQLTEEQKEELNHGNKGQEADAAPTEEPTDTPEVTPEEEEVIPEPTVMTPEPTKEVTPVPTKEPVVVKEDEDYIIPDSSTRYLNNADLASLSEWEIRIVRNEIYARHGRIFKSDELVDYFEGKDWYEGTIAPEMFDNSLLNAIEIENLKFITNYEKTHNLNQ